MTTAEMETMRDDVRYLKEHADTVLQSLEVIAQTIAGVAANQERFDRQLERLAEAQFRTDERLDKLAQAQFRTDEAVQRLSDTVDRYLNARLNGNQQN